MQRKKNWNIRNGKNTKNKRNENVEWEKSTEGIEWANNDCNIHIIKWIRMRWRHWRDHVGKMERLAKWTRTE